jgi:hypothetical protein
VSCDSSGTLPPPSQDPEQEDAETGPQHRRGPIIGKHHLDRDHDKNQGQGTSDYDSQFRIGIHVCLLIKQEEKGETTVGRGHDRRR